MPKLRYLTHPIESFRTAPLGLSILVLNLLNVVDETVSLVEHPHHGQPVAALGALAVSFAVSFISGSLTSSQFELRERLEVAIEKHGYDDRLLAPTTQEWCNRQTARVVCEQGGNLERYKELCDARQGTAELSGIPHI